MVRRFLHLLVLATLLLSISCTVVQAGWVERSDAPYAGGGAFHTHGVGLAGDLNSDGQITSADAIIALRIVANDEHNDDADIDRDGQVTSVDALMILQAATATPTPTPAPTVYISDLDLENEWVQMMNSGASSVTITGWKITDEDVKHTYIFPPFILSSGATVTLYTGKGADTDTELYWGSGGHVWNNDGDIATLYDANGNFIDALEKP